MGEDYHKTLLNED